MCVSILRLYDQFRDYIRYMQSQYSPCILLSCVKPEVKLHTVRCEGWEDVCWRMITVN